MKIIGKGTLYKILHFSPPFINYLITKAVNKPSLGKSVMFIGSVYFGPNVEIGDYSYIRRGSYLANVKIGKYCSIAQNVSIGYGEHDYKLFSTYPLYDSLLPNNENLLTKFNVKLLKHYSKNKKISVATNIGNDVWIGEGVSIKGGVSIGDGVVIGSKSMVTKDIPAYAIAAGNPARIIKYRFSEEKIDELIKLKWWNWSEQKINSNFNLLLKLTSDLSDN